MGKTKNNKTESSQTKQNTNFIKKHVLSYTTDPELVKQKRMEKQKLLDAVPDIIVCKERRNEIENANKKKRAKFITSDGWQFYKPTKPEEFIKIENRPHPARCEDLTEPYQELDGAKGRDSKQRQRENDNRPQFNQFTSIHSRLFGMKGNEEYWQSVFTSKEDEQMAHIQEMKDKELKEWNDKVVVDDIVFRVDLRAKSDEVQLVDKYKNILHGDPHKEALKYNTINPKWSVNDNICISQTAEWKYSDGPKTTITRTKLNSEEFLNGEFDHISKSKVLHSAFDNLSKNKSDSFAKITKEEIQQNFKLYGQHKENNN